MARYAWMRRRTSRSSHGSLILAAKDNVKDHLAQRLRHYPMMIEALAEVNRAFSANEIFFPRPWGVAPGLRLNAAPLALNTNSPSAKFYSAVYGRPGAGWPNSATKIFCSEKLSSVSIHWLPTRG
ncbi:MAG: hypothetical protein DMF38_08860 [Verrucomicrobia bacterium]|nr:MAG: hypothetical protein DMF38_08860 [Verrucomicrobiota bacterium]